MCRLFKNGVQEVEKLDAPDGTEEVDSPGAKELRYAEALDEAPVGTIGSEGEASGIVGKVAGCSGLRTVRDGDVVGFEELAGKIRGGGDDAEGGTKAEAK